MMLDDFNQLRLLNPSKPGGGQCDNRIVYRFHQECVKTEKVAWHDKCENLPTAIWHIPIAAGQAPANGKARLGASPSSAGFTAFWTRSCFSQSVSRKPMSSLERDTKCDRCAIRRLGLRRARPGIASSVE